MLGVSYLALSQYKVAALGPPALMAICPWEGFTDAYRDFLTPGGVVEDGFARVWLFATGRAARLRTDLAVERRKHPLRDASWESLTPSLSRIAVPILVCTSFSDSNLHSIGSLRAFQRVGSAERHAHVHRGPKWASFYGEEAFQAQLAFFDRHLRELDPALSTPHQPEHTFRTLQPVADGEKVEVHIPLSSSATLFHAGEQLRLIVAGRNLRPRNPFFGHFPAHYQPTKSGKATIFWAPGRASTLEIPVIPQ